MKPKPRRAVTDKERIDWLESVGYKNGIFQDAWGTTEGYWSLRRDEKKKSPRYKSLRTAIDAAMKAQRKDRHAR